jgi:hypothetical protein
VATLTGLAAGLNKQLANPTSFGALNTRVLLRTGINLRSPRPEQDNDRAAVEKVQKALADLGYRI